MRILVNLDQLKPPITGIGRYTRQLLQGLEQHRAITEVIGFANGVPVDSDTRLQSSMGGGRTAGTKRHLADWFRQLPGSHALYLHWRDYRFRRWAGLYRDAVYHEPNYILHPFHGPCVTTVHDLSYWHYPDYHPRQRVRLLETHLPRTLARADHVLTVSEFVKQELVSLLGINASRITVAPLAAAGHFQPYDSAQTRAVLQRHGLIHDRYLLSVATLEPRKNLPALIDGYRALRPDLRRRYPLVLVGASGWRKEQWQQQLRQPLDTSEIRHPGYVPETELPLIYAGARGFACTSVYEGFGLPPLEAMACGVPVLSANRSALPEVIGDAGLLVDPDDRTALSLALEQLLTDDTFRSHGRMRGLARARQFSWPRFTETVVSVYRKLAGAA